MKPAEKVALLTALKDAAEAELAKAKAEALALADTVGIKSFDTDFGALTVARKAAAPFVERPDMLLAYVKASHPTEVVTAPAVRPAFVAALLGRVVWAPELGEYVDPTTGEAVPGIGTSDEGAPYITWPKSDAQQNTKQEAREWFAKQSENILDGMKQLTS